MRRKHLDERLTPQHMPIYLTEERAANSLDAMLANNSIYWIDRWLDDYLETGASLNQVMNVLATWLVSRKTIAAFELVARAVDYAGRRQDINILDIDVEPSNTAEAIRGDTAFGVRRRTLF